MAGGSLLRLGGVSGLLAVFAMIPAYLVGYPDAPGSPLEAQSYFEGGPGSFVLSNGIFPLFHVFFFILFLGVLYGMLRSAGDEAGDEKAANTIWLRATPDAKNKKDKSIYRYDRAGLLAVMAKAGLAVDELWSWNVLLRPAAAWRRLRSTGSDLDDLPGALNLGLRAVIAAERYLPVRSLPGVSLMLRAHRPTEEDDT